MRYIVTVLLFIGQTAAAGPFDGFYSVSKLTDPHGSRTAAALGVEGCWSREVWAFSDNTLSRGHQRACKAGKNTDTCEAWLTLPISYDNGLTVPYGAESQSDTRSVGLTEATKAGDTSVSRTQRASNCTVRLEAARYQVTLQELDGTQTLVLSDKNRGITWELVNAAPEPAPFKGVAR